MSKPPRDDFDGPLRLDDFPGRSDFSEDPSSLPPPPAEHTTEPGHRPSRRATDAHVALPLAPPDPIARAAEDLRCGITRWDLVLLAAVIIAANVVMVVLTRW